MSQPRQVREVEFQFRFVFCEPFFRIAVLNLIEIEFEVGKEMPDELSPASKGPVSKSDFLVLGYL